MTPFIVMSDVGRSSAAPGACGIRQLRSQAFGVTGPNDAFCLTTLRTLLFKIETGICMLYCASRCYSASYIVLINVSQKRYAIRIHQL